MGIPLDDALQRMADRIQSDDFQSAVTAIAIQREVGGNLAEVLDIVARTIRERGALRRQISALTAEGRLSAYILDRAADRRSLCFLVVRPRVHRAVHHHAAGHALVFVAVLAADRRLSVAVQRDQDRGLDAATVAPRCVFVAVALGDVRAALACRSRTTGVSSRRLKDMTTYEIAQSKEAQPMLKSFGERVIAPSASRSATRRVLRCPRPTAIASPSGWRKPGVPGGSMPTASSSRRSCCRARLVALSLSSGVVAGWSRLADALLALIAGVVGVLHAGHVAQLEGSSRKHQIVRELPDMLDMLTISVEAGMGFDSALREAGKNSQGPLAEEFGRVLQEVQSGASRKDALRAMAERVDVPELSAFVASIVQADMFGVSIAQVLRAQVGEMRLRRRQRAEEAAQRAPVKMVFPLVLCILPCTLIVILGPAAIRIGVVLLGM